jgi:hypothetical protein
VVHVCGKGQCQDTEVICGGQNDIEARFFLVLVSSTNSHPTNSFIHLSYYHRRYIVSILTTSLNSKRRYCSKDTGILLCTEIAWTSHLQKLGSVNPPTKHSFLDFQHCLKYLHNFPRTMVLSQMGRVHSRTSNLVEYSDEHNDSDKNGRHNAYVLGEF